MFTLPSSATVILTFEAFPSLSISVAIPILASFGIGSLSLLGGLLLLRVVLSPELLILLSLCLQASTLRLNLFLNLGNLLVELSDFTFESCVSFFEVLARP